MSVASTTNPTENETVTSITAKTMHPGKATEQLFKQQGWAISLWEVFLYLLEANGLKEPKKIHDDYDNIDLDEIMQRGRFPYRPSDLFLKVL